MPGLLKIAIYITIAIIILFMFRKKEQKPSKMDMGLSKYRSKRSNKASLTGVRRVTPEVVDDNKTNLNNQDVINYNGKPYNVWQVLGIPSGASHAEIKKAFIYKTEAKTLDKDLALKAYERAISIN